MEVELDYWTARKRVEIELAQCATSPEAQLAHQELASRYDAKAASLFGLVIAQVPAAFHVADDFLDTTIGDPIVEAPRCGAL